MFQDQHIEWLLDCLRAGATEEKTARLGRLSESDWSQVCDVAMRHGVAPLLYDRLQLLASSGQVAAAVMQNLRGAYLANAARNVKIYHELGEVLTALQQAGLPVIVLKGAHLAELVYGNIALRRMGDLDLLVRKEDLAKATDELRELGYAYDDWQGIEAACAVTHHLPPFVRPNAAPIEIHWTITPPRTRLNIELDDLWKRSRPAVLAGVETRVLSPVDLFLHQCVHAGSHHNFILGLRPFCDIAATVMFYRNEMEWGQIQLHACQWGAEKDVHLTLRLLRRMLRVPVPEHVLESLRPGDFDDQWETLAWEQIHSGSEAGASWQEEFGSSNMAVMFGPKSVLTKSKVLLKVLFPAPPIICHTYRLPLHSKRVFFWYPVRLWYLVRRYLPIAWRILWREKPRSYQEIQVVRGGLELQDWLRA